MSGGAAVCNSAEICDSISIRDSTIEEGGAV
jgi:hypothetical protein